ncbi:hypothetical protein TRFO_01193 [Tritrichomonas foetus]|uniref:Uncharacterized protein n=1 Tax=Tritrichomonas foetus TaxID=1144522 RepID=A0A1J4KJ22_9EUKA|nr:hypothetical protein TRFO_01193 [Tritrichomonas foetus]|eukprot:OHT11235.1 hypothetical protein TRFO_01193 [Tritrichomonas foetus]
MTPLFLTARSGSAQIMNMLFDNKAKLDIKAKTSKYPLKETLRCGHIECFLILIERGVRPTASLDQRDYTPLMMAIRNDELHKAVPILLEHGANVNAMTKSGFSPLFLACRKRNLEIVQLLCNDPTLKLDITGQGDVYYFYFHSAPIHWAAFSCVPEIVQLIIDRGALVTAKNKMGETAISEALRFAIHSKSEPDKREKDIFDMLETLKILVKNGLSVNDQRNQQNDKSTAIQNYLTRPDSIDIRILDFLFSNGFDYNIVVSTRPAEAVGDRIWDMRLPTDIHDFVQKKLLELGYKPKMK